MVQQRAALLTDVAMSEQVFCRASDERLAEGRDRDADKHQRTTRERVGPNVDLVQDRLNNGDDRHHGDESDQAELPQVAPATAATTRRW